MLQKSGDVVNVGHQGNVLPACYNGKHDRQNANYTNCPGER